MRLPVAKRSIELSMLLLTLLAAAWAIKAPVFVPTDSAILKSPKLHSCFY
jgi:p-aminobenzoyl-glutamate transporter AbgT